MRGKTGADREISVNTYTGGFTTMLNHHLRNRNLSLKAVGLLSKMLSLPPDWDYSIRGLAMLNTDGIDGIRTAMKELEDEGYVVRVQSRDERGRMSRNKYTVYALPQKEKPSPDLPSSENPTTVKPPPDEPMTEKPTQINTNQVIPKKREGLGDIPTSIFWIKGRVSLIQNRRVYIHRLCLLFSKIVILVGSPP